MEVWKPLRNFPSYNGSSEGRIMNIRTQHILKPYVNEKGQATVCLRKNNRRYRVRVHRIIAETFFGVNPGMDVRHKDTNRLNNNINNLEWCTKQETIEDMRNNDRDKSSKCTPVRVVETGDIYESVSDCAKKTGCCRSDIFKQLAGKLSHVKGLHFERIHSSY